jgi:hypothetical protein
LHHLNASISDVDGVMGYHAPTVAPAKTPPSAAAELPSMMMEPLVASVRSSWLALPSSKQSNSVYLYATGDAASPNWTGARSIAVVSNGAVAR